MAAADGQLEIETEAGQMQVDVGGAKKLDLSRRRLHSKEEEAEGRPSCEKEQGARGGSR